MNDLRKAAEMALDALEADREHITYESAVYSAALALRQALAQPEEISDYHEGWEEGFKAGLQKHSLSKSQQFRTICRTGQTLMETSLGI